MYSDAELLQRYVREADEGAFAELVTRHLGVVYAAARRRARGRGDLAEEATQQVFCSLARKSASLMHHGSLIGWLYRSVRYAVIDALRAEDRRQKLETLAARTTDEPAGNATPVDWEEIRPWLDGALDDLRAADREAVLLRFFYNLSFREMGERLGVAENAARMRTERSLDRLRTLLARRGVRSTSAALAVALGHEACAALPAGIGTTVTQAALAAGPAHGVATTLTVLLMSKSTLPIISGLLAASLTAVVWTASSGRVSADELAALRAERDSLLQSNQTAATTSHPGAGAEAAVTATSEVSTDPTGRTLAGESQPSLSAAGAATSSPSHATPQVTARGHSNHGNATPEDAVMTFAWACDIADAGELERIITFDDAGRTAALEVLAGMPDDIRANHPTPEALYGMLLAASCLEAPPPGADLMRRFMVLVELAPGRYASRKAGSDRNVHEYQLTGDGWKYVMPVEGVRGLPSILNSETLQRLAARATANASTP